MDKEYTKCPRNCGGYLLPIGETEGGIIHKCFVCESQVSQPKPEGADAQFAASRVEPPDDRDAGTSKPQSRVLAYPEPATETDAAQEQEQEQGQGQGQGQGTRPPWAGGN
jgi:hypothetical protein